MADKLEIQKLGDPYDFDLSEIAIKDMGILYYNDKNSFEILHNKPENLEMSLKGDRNALGISRCGSGNLEMMHCNSENSFNISQGKSRNLEMIARGVLIYHPTSQYLPAVIDFFQNPNDLTGIYLGQYSITEIFEQKDNVYTKTEIDNFFEGESAFGKKQTHWNNITNKPEGFLYTDEEAQDAVGGILTPSTTIELTYNDDTPSITASVILAGIDHDGLLNWVADKHIDHTEVSIATQYSLTGGGDISATRTLSLVNDEDSPGVNKFYGTHVTTGVKGWYDSSGYVKIYGTPVDNQVAIWKTANSIEGSAQLTYDGTNLKISSGVREEYLQVSVYNTQTRIKHFEDTSGAAAGYGYILFQTNATVGQGVGLGGHIFQDGNNSNILVLENHDKRAIFLGRVGISLSSVFTPGANLDISNTTTAGAVIRLREGTNNGSYYIGFKAPDNINTSVTYTFPELGTTGYFLQLDDANGTLAWATLPDGFEDPMDYAGDMIYRNTSNLTDRLAVGDTVGKILTVIDGGGGIKVPGWQSPATGLTLGGDTDPVGQIQYRSEDAFAACDYFYFDPTNYELYIIGSKIGTKGVFNRNVHDGSSSTANFILGNDIMAMAFHLQVNSSNYTNAANYAYVYQNLNAPMLFGTNGIERLRINADGTTTFASVINAPSGTSTQWNAAYTHSIIPGGTGVHISGDERINWNAAYTHSQIAGGNSVHVSTTENTQWDAAYTHSIIPGGTGVHISSTERTNWNAAYAATHTRSHAITSTSDHTSSATPGRILKANASGLPVECSYNFTDLNLFYAVSWMHQQNTDEALGAGCIAQNHGTASLPMVGNICYGTGDPPSPAGIPEGTIFVKYIP